MFCAKLPITAAGVTFTLDQIKEGIKEEIHQDLPRLNGGCCCCPLLIQSGVAGHIVLDEDLERTVLVVNLGVIPPMETVHVLVSTSSELSTLPSGGIRVSSPPVCTPRVQRTINEEQGLSPNFSRT